MEGRRHWVAKRISRRTMLRNTTALGAGGMAAAVLGCGDDDDADQPSPEATGQAQEGQPKRGGTIAFAFTAGEQPHHDPHLVPNSSIVDYGSGVAFSRLVRNKVGPDVGSINVIPEGDLAASWEQPDETTYVFKLHPNVKWQNIQPVNGRQLTAEDVVYSLNRQVQLRATAGFLPRLRQTTAVDPLTVRLQGDAPDADFLVAMSATFNVTVPREAVEIKGDIKDGPVIGSGAWIFKDWVPNNKVSLVRNPDYFRKDQAGNQLPYADGLDILRILDPSVHMAAFRTRQVHFGSFEKDQYDQLKRENPNIKTLDLKYTGPVTGDVMLLRADTAPTNDVRVRKAINLALDRKVIKSTHYRNDAWAGGMMLHVPSEDFLLSDEEIERLTPFDVNQARQLLQQAGVTSWETKISAFGTNTTLPEIVQSQVKAIGVTGTIEPINNIQLAQWFVQHDRQFFPFIRGPQSWSMNADLRSGYRTGGAFNTAKLSDPELDRMIEAQASELKDRERRRTMIHQILRRIIDLAAYTPFFGSIRHVVISPDVHNVFHSYPTAIEQGSYEIMWLDR